jgi:hypothetical protein
MPSDPKTAGRGVCYHCILRFGAKVPNVPVGTVYGGRCYLCDSTCNAAIAPEGYIWPGNLMPTRDGGWRKIARHEPEEKSVPSVLFWNVIRGITNAE